MKSAILHHNYLCQTDNASFCPQGVADCEEMGELVNNNSPFLTPLSKVHGSKCKRDSVDVQDQLKQYVNSSEGNLD